MTGVNPAAGESVLPDLDTELVPDLTTELADAAAAQDAATEQPDAGWDPATRTDVYAVYDTHLTRYVTGAVTLEVAEQHGYSKGGRFRLHELDPGSNLARATPP